MRKSALSRADRDIGHVMMPGMTSHMICHSGHVIRLDLVEMPRFENHGKQIFIRCILGSYHSN